MSSDSQPNPSPAESQSPLIDSPHDAELLLKFTLSESKYLSLAPLPDTSARSVIPLNKLVLYPQSTAAYVICCVTHATSLMTPFFSEFNGSPTHPAPNHRPSVLMHSAHVRKLPELEHSSDARRHAFIWPTNSRRPYVFSFNEIVCPCCPNHASQLELEFRDTFSAYTDEIEEMNLPSVITVSRTGTPTHELSSSSTTVATPSQPVKYEPLHEQRPVASYITTPTLTVPSFPKQPSNETVSTPTSPSPRAPNESSSRSSLPAISQPLLPGTVIWSDDDSELGPAPTQAIQQPRQPPSRTRATVPYSVATNRAPIPVVSRQSAAHYGTRIDHTRPAIPAMTTALPAYVTDLNRPFYQQNFEMVATTLRAQMLLCLHVLDYPHPSTDAVTAARTLITQNIESDGNLRVTYGNYSFVADLFIAHLQDYHVNALRSSSDRLKDAISSDEYNCKILRCLFHYREGPQVDATVYLNSFNPLNSYYMILNRLDNIREATTPRMKVLVIDSHPSIKCYRLPPSDFDVDYSTRDPSTLTDVPPSLRHPRSPSTTSSRGSSSRVTRRAFPARQQTHMLP